MYCMAVAVYVYCMAVWQSIVTVLVIDQVITQNTCSTDCGIVGVSNGWSLTHLSVSSQ